MINGEIYKRDSTRSLYPQRPLFSRSRTKTARSLINLTNSLPRMALFLDLLNSIFLPGTDGPYE